MKYLLQPGPMKKLKAPAAKAPPSSLKEPSFFSRHKSWLIGFLVFLLIPAALWAFWPNFRLKKALALQAQLIRLKESDALKEERKKAEEELDQLEKDLKPVEKRALKREEERVQLVKLRQFAAMSQEERNQFLDRKLLKELEKLQKNQGDKKSKTREGAQQGGPGNGGNGGPGATGPIGQGQGPGQPEGGKVKPPSTPEREDNKFRDKLANSSPELRGLKYLMDVENQRRRAELGLPPGKGKGGF